jgi:uncharacterized LabA/DUF88 family protein
MSIYWLIDGSYIYKSVNRLRQVNGGSGLDYKRLKNKLEDLYGEKITAYYFNSTPNPPKDAQNSFHSWLKNGSDGPGIRVQLYQLKGMNVKCNRCDNEFSRTVQKGVDVGIVTAALKFKDSYDTLILSSGDGDFEDTVHYLKEDLNKRLVLLGFHGSLSVDLHPWADDILYIDSFFDEVKDTRFTEPFEHADEYIDSEL